MWFYCSRCYSFSVIYLKIYPITFKNLTLEISQKLSLSRYHSKHPISFPKNPKKKFKFHSNQTETLPNNFFKVVLFVSKKKKKTIIFCSYNYTTHKYVDFRYSNPPKQWEKRLKKVGRPREVQLKRRYILSVTLRTEIRIAHLVWLCSSICKSRT